MGIALLAAGFILLQLFFARVLALSAGDGSVAVALGGAFLGLGAAGATAASLRRDRAIRLAAAAGPWLCLLDAAARLAALYAASRAATGLAAELDGFLLGGLASEAAGHLAATAPWRAARLGAALTAPHFLSGLALALLFRVASEREQPRLYARDLAGAALGALLGGLAAEYGGWRAPLALAVGAPLAAASFLPGARGARAAAAGALALWSALMLSPAGGSLLEPRPSLRMLSGVRDPEARVVEEWRSWNAYTRVSALRVEAPGSPARRFYAFGTGQGRAEVARPGDPGNSRARLAAALGAPGRALVLFAGAGAEAAALDALAGGRAGITAVEINRPLARRALEDPETARFFARPGLSLRVEEARSFLERDRGSYDLILAPYFGSAYTSLWQDGGDLAQHTYTREAYRAALARLSPSGRLVVFDANKIIVLASLRALLEESGRGDAGDCAAILSLAPLDADAFLRSPLRPRRELFLRRDWNSPLDNLALVFKPSGLTPRDVARLRGFAKENGLSLLYEPGTTDPDNPYRRVLREPDARAAVAALEERGWIRLSPLGDDRPSLARRRFGRWAGLAAHLANGPALRLAAAAALLALLAGRAGGGGAALGAFFAASSGAFLLLETGLILKLTLLLGGPGFALPLGLFGLLLPAGWASLRRAGAAGADAAALARAAALAALACAAAALLADAAIASLLRLPLAARAGAALLLLAPLGWAAGVLFPAGLLLARRRDERWTARAWAVSGFMSVCAAAAAGPLARLSGRAALLWAAAALYLAAAAALRRLDRA